MAGAEAGNWGCECGLWARVMVPSPWHCVPGLASEEGSYEGAEQAPHPVPLSLLRPHCPSCVPPK